MLFICSIFVTPPVFAVGVDSLGSLGITYALNNNSSVSGNNFDLSKGSSYPLIFTFTENGTYTFEFVYLDEDQPSYLLGVWNGGNSDNTFDNITNGTLTANGNTIKFGQGYCAFSIDVTTASSESPATVVQFSNVYTSSGSTVSQYSYTITDLSVNGANASEPTQAIVSVEPGYVAYIGITGGNAIFTATFNKKQPKGSIFTNIRMGFSSSRPSESSTITMDGSIGNVIPFVTDRPYDIWGKSFNGRYGVEGLSPSYMIVYVPLTDPDGNTNATVKVSCSEFLNVVQFPLSASMVGGEIISSGDSDIFYASDSSLIGEDFRPQYVYSDNGVTSSAITLPAGGNNIPPTSSGGSLIEQFTGLLSDLINRIESLLIAPVEYIKWIISSSQNFMSWLSAVWTWLPAPVYDTIVAVLLILVVVGALKLLWR